MGNAPLPKHTLKYRPDIDGMRAVAVLAVMAFHIGIFRVAGGYAGVDVFFVISGYLISSIMFTEIAESRFSVIAFYERRIRRIFPALFGMLIGFSIFATIFFLPAELIVFGKSMMATAVSCSNFYLWGLSGYFDGRNENPLLHTWSLAVEEQFYIFFPLFLIAVRRFFPHRLKVSVAALFTISLVLSAWTVFYNQNSAFYLPYARAWELLLGTMLALKMFPHPRTAMQRNLTALAGLGLIAYFFLGWTDQAHFPGLAALIPCAGSAMIIGAGETGSSVVGAVLSWRPMVFVGLISYSLYLWHWPVVVLTRMGLTARMSESHGGHFAALLRPDRFTHLIQVVASFVLATLSWRFIERPFRKGRLRLGGRPLFALAGATTLLCILFSSVVVFAGGLTWRFSQKALQVASYLDESELQQNEKAMRVGECFVEAATPFEKFDLNLCLHQDANKKNYLLIGDSHAAVLWPAIAAALPDVNVMQATAAACRPFPHQKVKGICSPLMDYIFEDYLVKHRVDKLLLEARWDSQSLSGLEQTLQWAQQHHVPVIVFGSVPEYDASLPRLLAYSITRRDQALPAEHLLPNNAQLDRDLRSAVGDRTGVEYVSLYQLICGSGSCEEYADDAHTIPLMHDSNHLDRFGSQAVIRKAVAEGELH
jgi:peptidoglycan/LPS O-acetylase OafA/YrhL